MSLGEKKMARYGFNPRAREGATALVQMVQGGAASFNPRAREGATGLTPTEAAQLLVSTHAPVRARHEPAGRANRPDSFNPRAREGATRLPDDPGPEDPKFQPTRP